MEGDHMSKPLIRMSKKGEEFVPAENEVRGDVRYLAGRIETQHGTLDDGITFEIPADVEEVRLAGSTVGWYLNDENHPRGWKAGIKYPDNELD